MKALSKTLLALTTAAGLGLATISVAGPGSMGDCPMGGYGKGYGRMGGNPEQHMAMKKQFHAEQMELLAGRLNLSADQQPAWKAFLAAQDAHLADKMNRHQAMRDQQGTTPMAHMDAKIQGMEQHLASMKAMAKATGDFYATLNPTQKQAMDEFFASRPMHRMMGGKGGPAMPPAAPTQ